MRIGCAWIPLTFSSCWQSFFCWVTFELKEVVVVVIQFCGFLFELRKFTWWELACLRGLLSDWCCSLPDTDTWMGLGCKPAQARCQLSNAAQWFTVSASCRCWGRDLSSKWLWRNSDASSFLGMWEQCSSTTKQAVSVKRKPEKILLMAGERRELWEVGSDVQLLCLGAASHQTFTWMWFRRIQAVNAQDQTGLWCSLSPAVQQ